MMSPSFLTLQQRQFLALIMITAVAFSNTQAQLVSAQANNNSGNAACFSLQGSVACPHLSAYRKSEIPSQKLCFPNTQKRQSLFR